MKHSSQTSIARILLASLALFSNLSSGNVSACDEPIGNDCKENVKNISLTRFIVGRQLRNHVAFHLFKDPRSNEQRLINAYYLGLAADLAYLNQAHIQQVSHSWGFEKSKLLCRDSDILEQYSILRRGFSRLLLGVLSRPPLADVQAYLAFDEG
jgi:hypothetical protein